MNGQQGKLAVVGVAELAGLAGHRRPADDDVSQVGTGLSLPGWKGKHVGCVVLAQEAAIETPQLAVSGNPHSELPSRGGETRCDLGYGGRRFDHRADPRRRYRGAHGLHNRDHCARLRPRPRAADWAFASTTLTPVTGLLLFLHARLAGAAILFAFILALWGTYQYLRHSEVSGGFRAAYLMLSGLVAVQGLIGVLNLLVGTKLHNSLHVVYGIFAVVFLPGLYFYSSSSGRSPKVRESALLAAACWVVLVALGRGWVTGQ
jgi:hypothetical protein